MKKYYFRKKLLLEQSNKLGIPINDHFYDDYDGKEVIFFSNVHGHCIDENGSAMFRLILKEWCEVVEK